MGLFGLFAMLFGGGAVIGESISNSISDTIDRDKAMKRGSSIYVNNGKFKSTVTGRPCSDEWDFSNHHHWLTDLQTGERIEDITEKQNIERTAKNKREAAAKGSKFYRTAQWDAFPRYQSSVYVNDDMPGRYFWQLDKNDPVLRKRIYWYIEGELVDCELKISDWRGKKYVKTPRKSIWYNADGTVYKDERE